MQRDIEYIRMVYKTGSFSKAAELLFASQPTVSLAVQRVEEELGVRLFERGTSPLRPTEAGKRYLAHADRIAQSDAQLRRELDGIHDRFREQLRLGCLPMHTQSLINICVPPIWGTHYISELEFDAHSCHFPEFSPKFSPENVSLRVPFCISVIFPEKRKGEKSA